MRDYLDKYQDISKNAHNASINEKKYSNESGNTINTIINAMDCIENDTNLTKNSGNSFFEA